jgi:hypothetical protein
MDNEDHDVVSQGFGLVLWSGGPKPGRELKLEKGMINCGMTRDIQTCSQGLGLRISLLPKLGEGY